jgi:hypothetical protein
MPRPTSRRFQRMGAFAGNSRKGEQGQTPFPPATSKLRVYLVDASSVNTSSASVRVLRSSLSSLVGGNW